METTKSVPFKKWPWWVKIITIPMVNKIKPGNQIGFVITLLLIISYCLAWKDKVITQLIMDYTILSIILINIIVLVLWQVIATMWIKENSSWELIKVSIFKKILTGSLLLITLFAIPIIIIFL